MDADGDSRSYFVIMGGCIVGLILGIIVTDGLFLNIVGAFSGLFIGGFIAMIVSLATGKPKSESQPPEFQIANESIIHHESQAREPSTEARLSSLEVLRVKGLISREEYAERRAEILRSL